MFPLSASGHVRVSNTLVNAEALTREIERRVTSLKPSFLIGEHVVYFEAGPLRFALNTNLLVPISRGTIEISEQAKDVVASYELSFKEIVIVGTFLAAMIAFMSPVRWIPGVPVFAWCWLFLVGGNYLICVVRFRAMLREAGTGGVSR